MIYAIILSAGKSERLGIDKNFLQILKHPLISYTISAFNAHQKIEKIIVVANKKNKIQIEKLIKKENFNKVEKVILGGNTRQNSLLNAVKYLQKKSSKSDIILVHNSANPLVSKKEITDCVLECKKGNACVLGHFSTDTVKEVEKNLVKKTLNRDKIFLAQTPQASPFGILEKAILVAQKTKFKATDESMLLENIGQKVVALKASENNFKITTQKDYLKLKAILRDYSDCVRVGIGQDSHLFDDKKGLWLGGVLFKKFNKLNANSDGDVILHSVFNGISQAIGEKSLGYFADPLCKKGIKDSKKYMAIILEKMNKKNYEINNLGIMIECKIPKIDPIEKQIKKSLSKILNIDEDKIGITATSGEGASTFGRGNGMQCFSAISLIKKV
jgi:2-C-methyl-D-erythritol 4-phosphate cytidylyltransferase/2-C-methyl-D-erythritol 2,4-cyclodiphosphate synthase